LNKIITGILYLIILFYVVQAKDKHWLRVSDMWSGKPLPGVCLISGKDTLCTNNRGLMAIDVFLEKEKEIYGKLFKEGYFPLNLTRQALQNRNVYLLPVETLEAITVVASAEAQEPLAIPAHISRIDFTSGIKKSGKELDQILAQQSGIFIKSYGAYGQLQTISLRGMSASQTQVLFDGVPLNSMQLGSVNLAEYDIRNLKSMEIYRGGNALFGGSGAIGGVVNLHPLLPSEKWGYRIQYRQASFGNAYYFTDFNIPIGRFKQRFFFSRAHGENRYQTIDKHQKVWLSNRDFENRRLEYQTRFQILDRMQFSSYISSYKYKGGSPKPFTGAAMESSNQARTATDHTLGKIKGEYFSKKGSVLFQGYFRNEWMSYLDPLLIINQKTLHNLYFNQEQGLQLRIRRLFSADFLVSSGLEITWQKAYGNSIGLRKRKKFAAYFISDYQVLKKQRFVGSAHLNGSVRIEKYDFQKAFLLPAVGITTQGQHWEAFFTSGKNYRAPTFNDLYWRPGGNPNLEVEKSLNNEAGIRYHSSGKFLQWNIFAGVFMNRVQNQIQWLPKGTLWEPENIAAVFSRGLEWEIHLCHVNQIHQMSINYTYGRSEKDKATITGDHTVGHQLPFLPREQWTVILQSGFDKFRFGLQSSHSSFRYASLENEAQDILPSFTTASFWVHMYLKFFRQKVMLGIATNNLFNKQYEIVKGYPMPPRNYSFSLQITH